MASNGLLACALIFFMCIDVAAASRVRSVDPSAPAAAVNKGMHVVDNGPGRRKQKEQRVPQIEALGCNENPMKLRGQGEGVAASDSIAMMAGSEGTAVAQCIESSSCSAPYLQFEWQSGPARAGKGHVTAAPRCARGDWQPLAPPPVRVAAHGSTAVFASAGCLEVWSLQDHEVWSYITSLPASLDLANDETFVPWAFGTQVSVSEGVMAVSAQVRKGIKTVPAVAMYISISRTEWVLAEVLKCESAECYHVPQPCTTQGAFPSPEESPTGCMGGGFASAIAVKDQLLVVGIPNNSSVVLYRQMSLGDQAAAAAESGRGGLGAGLVWKFEAVLQGPAMGSASDACGYSIALSSSVLIFGCPSAEPTAGAFAFSLLTDSAEGGAKYGELILDVRQQCCMLKLPCCQSALVGRSVAQMQQGSTAQLAIGDPANDGALLVDCDLSLMQDGPSNSRSPVSTFCSVTAHVTDPSPGTETAGDTVDPGRRMGASVAMGGSMVLFGNPAAGCSASHDDGRACGQVCHAACCPPGSCRLYDLAIDNHVCLKCTDEGMCKGGIEECNIDQIGFVAVLLIGATCLMILCCCLCAVNLRLVMLTSGFELDGCFGAFIDIVCCIPRASDVEDDREDRLLGGDELGEGGEAEEEEQDDPVGKGYLPPAVSKALRAMAGERKKRDGGSSDGAEKAGARTCEEVEAPQGAAGGGTAVADDGDMAGERGDVGSADGEGAGAKDGDAVSGEGDLVDDSADPDDDGEGRADEAAAADCCEDPEDGDEKIGISIDYFCCKKCNERAIETVLVPCGHKAFCKRCARGLKECGVCKAKVTRVQTIFHV